jgi:hypothetical protein
VRIIVGKAFGRINRSIGGDEFRSLIEIYFRIKSILTQGEKNQLMLGVWEFGDKARAKLNSYHRDD